MDPYIEDPKVWADFHHQFIACLYQILLPGLVDRYRARIQVRQYTSEMPLFTSVIREQHSEEYIEIRHRSDDQLTTLVDLVSPTNKQLASSREAYLKTRQMGRAQRANLVEIDLIYGRPPMIEFSRDGLPESDYAVTVTRSTHPDRYEIYGFTLRKRLPRFKIPLANDDRDTVLDLQAAFTRCYDQSGLANRLNYRNPPPVPLKDDDLDWVDALLRQQKLR
jgi:hypothetical protein